MSKELVEQPKISGTPLHQLTPEEENRLTHLFTYHSASETETFSMLRIRTVAHVAARVLFQECPDCPDRSTALRKLREAVMSANASIVLKGQS